jgi:hypothetical protein
LGPYYNLSGVVLALLLDSGLLSAKTLSLEFKV